LQSAQPVAATKAPKPPAEPLVIHGVGEAHVKQSGRGKKLKIELQSDDKDFVSWLEGQTPEILSELHNRWKQQQNN
jgi:ParB family chromosome partitioning protein